MSPVIVFFSVSFIFIFQFYFSVSHCSEKEKEVGKIYLQSVMPEVCDGQNSHC